MTTSHQPPSRAEQVQRIIEDCLRRRAAGEPIDQEQVVDQHQDLLPELAEELRRLKLIEEARKAAEQAQPEPQDGIEHSHPTSGRGLHVRCPHCRNQIELVVDAELKDIVCESCGSSFSLLDVNDDTASAPAVRSLGHFELVEQVGVGAIGTVWKAHDTSLDRTVAIKIPRRGQLSDAEIEKFFREARAAAQLQHPNIVNVHEVGREKDAIYIVSDYVRGVTLTDWLSVRQPTPREAARLCATIAAALHHAHEAGVVHRDLKPSNILLDGDEEPHVTDFGLAKRDAGEITMTADGAVLGTPAYMSPEQARGEGHAADRRSDVYALGVILFELLTGERPFRGNMRMLLHQVVHDEPPVPRRLNSNIPLDLDTICLKCLEKDPDKRYETSAALSEDLGRYLNHQPIRARRIGRGERLLRWARRNPAVAGLTSAAAILLVAVAATSLAGYVTSEYYRRNAEDLAQERGDLAREKGDLADRERDARQQADNALEAAELTNADLFTLAGLHAGERDRYAEAALWFANAAVRSDGDPERQRKAMIRIKTWSQELPWPVAAVHDPGMEMIRLEINPTNPWLLLSQNTDREWTVWDMRAGRRWPIPEEFQAETELITAAAWSPDGEHIAVGVKGHGVVVLDVKTRMALWRPDHPTDVSCLRYSPNGQYLAVASKHVQVWDTDEHKPVTPHLEHERDVFALGFDARSTLLATTTTPAPTHVPHVSVFRLIDEDPSHDPLYAPVLHYTKIATNYGAWPQGAVIVGAPPRLVTAEPKALVVRDAISGRIQRRFNMGDVAQFDVLANGRYAAVTRNSKRILLLDLTETPSSEAFDHTGLCTFVAFSPDRSMLATGGEDGAVRFLSVPDAREVVAPLHLVGNPWKGAYSSDGGFFVTADRNGLIQLWSIPTRPPWHWRFRAYGINFGCQISPDGAYGFASGTTYRNCNLELTEFRDLKTRRPVGCCVSPGGTILDSKLSPLGDHLAIAASADRSAKRSQSGNRAAGYVALYDWRDGSLVFPEIQLPSEPRGIDFSSDGAMLAVVCASGEVLLINSINGDIWGRWDSESTYYGNHVWFNGGAVRFSADDRLLFIWSGRREVDGGHDGGLVHVFDAVTERRPYPPLEASGRVLDAALSDNGRNIACASDDGVASVWDVKTGRELVSLKHPDEVISCQFSHDGRYLVTAGGDRSVRVWDWSKGRQASAAMLHDENSVLSALFSPDGEWVISGGLDNTVRVWDWKTGRLIGPIVDRMGETWRLVGSRDGRRAIAAGAGDYVDVLHLDALYDPIDANASGLRIWAELLSAARIDESGGLIRLTAEEWISQFRDFCASGDVQPLGERHRHHLVHPDVQLARRLRARGEYEAAVVAAARAIGDDAGDIGAWELWLAIQLVDLKRSADAVLGQWPKAKEKLPLSYEDNVRYVLSQLSTGEHVRINCGGGPVSANGREWRTDCLFLTGWPYALLPSSRPVKETETPDIYVSERWFDREFHEEPHGYRIPLPVGLYRVHLHMVEAYFSIPGQRQFDVSLEERRVLRQYEPPVMTADVRTFDATVEDGFLDIVFKQGANRPKISAVEVEAVTENGQ